MNNKKEHLTINSYQKQIIENLRLLELSEPFEPWGNRTIINAGGCTEWGWTLDNKILILSMDGYSITNPENGEKEIRNKDPFNPENLAKDNLSFFVKELDEKVKIFGVNAGEGNHKTSDNWILEPLTFDILNMAIGLRKPYDINGSPKEFWEGIALVRLERLEYFGLKCGFSPDERYFGIFGSGGAEIFSR